MHATHDCTVAAIGTQCSSLLVVLRSLLQGWCDYKLPLCDAAACDAAGMLATYHRVVKPHTWAAAVASSAPNNYAFGTEGWAQTSNQFHVHIADSLDMNSGSKECSKTVRQGLELLMQLSRSPAGRQHLAATFNVCNGSAVLATDSDGFQFFMDQYGAYQSYAQVSMMLY